ncbi:DNRLRE domain-containing protein [Massilia dura]|uniref:DNRLRE domain-containing protein n=1 Tax=Pseudoduganella dura TaxID=321982 RepID=A0A6I3XIQ7_9BURK|nr:DNRLRE domain-containing protein [Pseudoduganella dura]MUI15386.1 DNRLRE domain-containing protein [Pseudoduganella dura]GGX80304.1 hypothetical protein GCM10007386_09070 [Pseudoduganella dura]
MIRRQSGALLLMVALLLAIIAALSFGLNRAAGMDAVAVKNDYDVRAARYLAEAGVAAARWSNQVKGCTSASILPTAFGTGNFEASVTKSGSKRLNIFATGTAGNGVVRTVTRNGVDIVDFNAKTSSSDLGAAALDTTIDAGSASPDSAAASLSLASGTAHALLYWPASEIGSDTRVLSATLILTQNGSSAVARPVGVHRVTTQWDANATWFMPRFYAWWTGGNYAATAAATTGVAGAGSYSWDVTSLVDGWVTGRLANYGMLLRLVNPGQAVVFYSHDASESRRPILRVVTAKAC